MASDSPTAPARPTPPGFVGIYTDPEGHVIATISYFEERPKERQLEVARHLLAQAVLAAYCSEAILHAFDRFDVGTFIRKLEAKGGKATLVPVGYDNDGE